MKSHFFPPLRFEASRRLGLKELSPDSQHELMMFGVIFVEALVDFSLKFPKMPHFPRSQIIEGEAAGDHLFEEGSIPHVRFRLSEVARTNFIGSGRIQRLVFCHKLRIPTRKLRNQFFSK